MPRLPPSRAGQGVPQAQGRAVAIGEIWLRDLPHYLDKWGVDWDAWPGWETRARSSGGYTAVQAIQVHHTVSRTTMAADARYCWETSSTRPIGALLLGRTGKVLLGAAGATNTSGKGGPMLTSRGVIPLDSGNTRIVAIEAANDGVGEVWPDVQQDAYVNLVCAVKDCVDDTTPGPPLDWGAIHSHREWAPLRKVDTRGPCRWAVDSTPTSRWDMGAFRFSCAERWAEFNRPAPPPPLPDPTPTPTPPTPGPTDEDDDTMERFIRPAGSQAIFACFPGRKVWMVNHDAYTLRCNLNNLSGHPERNEMIQDAPKTLMQATYPVDGPVPPGHDAWGSPL